MIAISKLAPPVLAAVLLAGCSGTAPDAERSPTPRANLTVTVAAATSGPFTTSITATGNVAARQMVLVSAQSAGLKIREVPVAEGDLVKTGDVLIRLQTDQLETQIEQQLAANRGLETSLDGAQLAYDRGLQLSKTGNLSASELLSRQTALDAARSTLEQGEAALKALHVQVAQATILSPVDGRLASASPPVGQVAQAGVTLFSIIEEDVLEVQAKVPEQLLGKIGQDQTVRVSASDGNGVVGTVRAIAQQVDAMTRLGVVYVTLPGSSGFRIGMSARVTFETALADVVTVPDTALAWRDGGTGVFKVDSQETVHFTEVESGDRQNGRVIVLSGLAAGDPVAVDGVGFLNDGMTVRVAEATLAGAQ